MYFGLAEYGMLCNKATTCGCHGLAASELLNTMAIGSTVEYSTG